MKSTPTSYGSIAVTIHWLSAVLVIVLLGSGFRAGLSEAPEAKAAILSVHIPVAIVVLLLTLVRLLWWWRFDRKPEPLTDVPHWQEVIARWTHRLLYLFLAVMLVSGLALSIQSGAPAAVFGDAPMPLFTEYAPRLPHGIAAKLLAGLIILHAAAALYHHIIKRDRTLRRMWFTATDE
jgi:cytochrome b561